MSELYPKILVREKASRFGSKHICVCFAGSGEGDAGEMVIAEQPDEMCSLAEYLVSAPAVLGSLPSPKIIVYTFREQRSAKEG